MRRSNLVRASRDGDQFHYLWAARRCLELLSTRSDLVAVSIESPSPDENPGGPSLLEGEEVIDVAEYYGSEKITEARLVRYIQLKHSTLQTTEPWTASGLEKTLRDFAKRYRELLQTLPDSLASKLVFCFVTNRPIATKVTEAVADIAAGSKQRHKEELQKVERFTGLTGSALSEFAKLLHFEGGQDDYWDQRNILFQDVSGYLTGADFDAPGRLKELVTRRALSEGERNPTITKMDVLRALGTDEGYLFPANCLIKRLDTTVPRLQEPDLIREIVEAQGPVIVHAWAGVGKTVFATRIERGLPIGSTCILFDCFGNGQYRNASSYRHRHKDALVQIANELAARRLCHLLIPTPHADSSDYLRAFIHRLAQAALLSRLANPGAIICIVVDAADNAQMAANEVGEPRSFVRDLIREPMPDGVRLVFLCRSHRQGLLGAPIGAIRLELRPFILDETATYLRQRFADASRQDIEEFHRLSSENPRVQALALSRNMTLHETLHMLGPNPTTVEDTIGNLLEDAIANLRDNVGPLEQSHIDKICAGLAALRPLIPIPILSMMSGVEEDAVKSFAIDLGRPLLVAGDTIQFIDEPAETWFRDRFRPSPGAMKEFVTTLEPFAKISAYVASALPQLMLEAGMFSELVTVALTSAALPEASPIEKRDLELQRLQFALKASLRAKRWVDAAKLALKAGGETAGEDRQREIIQANTDLVTTFLELDRIQEIVSRRTLGSGWRGSHNAYEASLLSGRRELVGDARSRLRMAHEWLRNWSRLPSEERHEEEISDQDIVELTLAHFNIHGPADGARSLREWRPREVSLRVGRILARRFIDHGRYEELNELAIAAENNVFLVLAIIIELRDIQRAPHAEVVRRAFRLISSSRIKLRDGDIRGELETALNAVTALVEAALQLDVCTAAEASAVLTRYLPNEPPRGLSSRYTTTRGPVLRAYCLRAVVDGRALELRDLAHTDLRGEMDRQDQHTRSRELDEFKQDIGALLPWYKLRAATLSGKVTRALLDEELAKANAASRMAAAPFYRDDSHVTNEIAHLWLEILQESRATDTFSLAGFFRWRQSLKNPLWTSTLTRIARLWGRDESTRALALESAIDAFTLIKGERSNARTKAEGFVDLARAVLNISKADAKEYFNAAVEVVSRIGDENISRWDAIVYLADRASQANYPVPEVAYQFARCAEVTYDYVVRDKHFHWFATVEALCGLCPASALTILSRWRDRGFGSAQRLLPIAVRRLVEMGRLEPRDTLPLVGFRANWQYEPLLDSVLARSGTQEEKESSTAHLFRYMQMSGVDCEGLSEVVSRHGVRMAGLDSIAPLQAKGQAHDSEFRDVTHRAELPERDWEQVFAGCDLTHADGLLRAHAAFQATDPPFNQELFFAEIIRRVPVGSEVGVIRALGDVPTFDLYHLRQFVDSVPREWKVRPAVMRELAKTLKGFCRRYCMDIAKSRYFEILPFKSVTSATGVSESDLAEIVLGAIGETHELADSDRLFSLIGLLTCKLSETEALDVLTFGLDLFNQVLEDKDGDGPWSINLLPPTDVRVALAGYIWASLAAPEGTTRWEGAHVVLGLVTLGREELLGHLFRFAQGRTGGPFVDSQLAFYYLHALQWLTISLARAATGYPMVLAPLASQIVDWALKDQAHVLIRQFASRAALALVSHGLLADNDDLKGRLSRVNVSPYPVVEAKSWDRYLPSREDSGNVESDDRFYFGIDIGPYWFQPLGTVFALTQKRVESEALKVIRDDMGFTEDGRWDEDERHRKKLYAEGQTYHSHGSHPRSDTLAFYYSYHALMVVAGKLLADLPTHRSVQYGDEDEFADWLARHDLSRRDGRWLWDRRDPPPMEVPAWQRHTQQDAAWRVAATDDFDQKLKAGIMLNLWGYWVVADSEREESVHIRSALVSPGKSAALLRALSTTKNVHNYALPDADSNMEIEETGFTLKGWIVEDTIDRGLDEQDPWAGGISFPPPIPANYVADMMGLEADLDRRVWRDGEQQIAFVSQVWGHYERGERNGTSNPERGSRLQARWDFLPMLLAKVGLELIIEVQIDRRRRYRPQESGDEGDQERIPTQARLYILGLDGLLRTL